MADQHKASIGTSSLCAEFFWIWVKIQVVGAFQSLCSEIALLSLSLYSGCRQMNFKGWFLIWEMFRIQNSGLLEPRFSFSIAPCQKNLVRGLPVGAWAERGP